MATGDATLATALRLHQSGQLQEAEQIYRQMLAADPNQFNAVHLLGVLAYQTGRLPEAIELLNHAVRLQPGHAESHNNLGVALAEQGRFEEACAAFRRAAELDPAYAEAHRNLGSALMPLRRPAEAQASYERALALKPDYVEAHDELGNALKEQGRFAEAMASHERALALDANYVEARWNRSLLWLAAGDFEKGWPEYEWRYRRRNYAPRSFRQPRWEGEALAGRTLFLYAEQGLGDTLQFVRYVPLVNKDGGRVIVECQPPLFPFLASCRSIDQLVMRGGSVPGFDVHASLMSFPALFGTTLDTIPRDVPYLSVNPGYVDGWREVLGDVRGLKVGIAWQGSRTHLRDAQRSVPLVLFEPLARLAHVRLFSLQKGEGADQVASAAQRFPIIDLGSQFRNFEDTAGVMKNLDLVVTVDSAVAHCAGVLGVPVWVVLPFVPDWRWLLDREDSPWYPTMRLFRQKRRGEWPEVLERVAAELPASDP